MPADHPEYLRVGEKGDYPAILKVWRMLSVEKLVAVNEQTDRKTGYSNIEGRKKSSGVLKITNAVRIPLEESWHIFVEWKLMYLMKTPEVRLYKAGQAPTSWSGNSILYRDSKITAHSDAASNFRSLYSIVVTRRTAAFHFHRIEPLFDQAQECCVAEERSTKFAKENCSGRFISVQPALLQARREKLPFSSSALNRNRPAFCYVPR